MGLVVVVQSARNKSHVENEQKIQNKIFLLLNTCDIPCITINIYINHLFLVQRSFSLCTIISYMMENINNL